MTTRAALLLASSLTVTGCDDQSAAHRPPPPTDSAEPEVAFDSVDRPTRTYWADNDEGRCAIYWEQPEATSRRMTIVCPREIEPGEKMRLAGQSCLRQSPKPERQTPVRCLKALFWMRQADRSAGKVEPEYHLPPAKDAEPHDG